MILDGRVEPLDRSGVERDLRLLEQPDRPTRGEDARQGERHLLTGRTTPGGRSGERRPAERGTRAVETRVDARAEILAPEGEVLAHAHARLQRVEMADIVAKLGPLGVGFGAFDAHASCREREQSGDLAQQAGLAGTVRAADQQRLPGSQREAQTLEHGPAAALATQVISGKADRVRHLLRIYAG